MNENHKSKLKRLFKTRKALIQLKENHRNRLDNAISNLDSMANVEQDFIRSQMKYGEEIRKMISKFDEDIKKELENKTTDNIVSLDD